MAESSLTHSDTKYPLAEYDDDLELRLIQVGKIFDLPHILNEPRSLPQVAKYYKTVNRFGTSVSSAGQTGGFALAGRLVLIIRLLFNKSQDSKREFND